MDEDLDLLLSRQVSVGNVSSGSPPIAESPFQSSTLKTVVIASFSPHVRVRGEIFQRWGNRVKKSLPAKLNLDFIFVRRNASRLWVGFFSGPQVFSLSCKRILLQHFLHKLVTHYST